MRKATHFKVSGVVETKPTNLPEGLTVTEVSVNLPEEEITIRSFHGSDHRVGESISVENAMTIAGVGLLEKEEVRRLRDFCNKVLGEQSFTGRVLVDDVRDVWFEFAPNRWTQGNDRLDTNPNPLQRARERLIDQTPTSLVEQTLEEINRKYGPVKFIDNTWE